jgi:hypothetical protein
MEKLMKFYERKLKNGNLQNAIKINKKNMTALGPYLSAMCPRNPGELSRLLGMEIIEV